MCAEGTGVWRIILLVTSLVNPQACTRSLLKYANNMKWIALNHEETMIDEYAGWALAAVGVYFQVFVVNTSSSLRP